MCDTSAARKPRPGLSSISPTNEMGFIMGLSETFLFYLLFGAGIAAAIATGSTA